MRSVAACLLISGLSSLVVTADSNAPEALTVLFQFDGPYSERSLAAMKSEFAVILKGSGVNANWRHRSKFSDSDSPPNLIVVKFSGKCVLEPIGQLYDERG